MEQRKNNNFKNLFKNAIDKDALKKALSDEKSRREIMAVLSKIKY